MSYAPQSSPPLRRLPACLLLIAVVLPSALSAQDQQRATAETRLTKAPDGPVIGTLAAGSQVASGKTQSGWRQVTLDGWIISRSITAAAREGFDVAVTHPGGENVRMAPGGGVLARLNQGALLNKVEARNGWTHVRRTLWAKASAFGETTVSAAATPASTGSTAPDPASDRVELLHATSLSAAAQGETMGTLTQGAQARVLQRINGWVRLQVEGWVPDSSVKSADSGVLIGVSQAEVRADPAKFTGQVVEWRLQFIAVQKADELRPEIPSGQAYLLTRGPLPEAGFVYVIVPPDQLEQFKATPPLQELTVRAVLKSPTTKYLPNPVVELVKVVGTGQGTESR